MLLKLDEFIESIIESKEPVDPHQILATISSIENVYGKQVYQKMKKEEIRIHEYFAENAGGYTNYALYYSSNTKKIYCIHIGMYGKFENYSIIEDESIFDKYIYAYLLEQPPILEIV